MAKYQITKCDSNRDLVGVEYESIIIKGSMTIAELANKLDKLETNLVNLSTLVVDGFKTINQRIDNLVVKNNLVE